MLEADAHDVEFPREAFRVVANLPFHGTSEILRHLLDDPRVPLVRTDLVVQWGAAVKRALPRPNTVYGAVWVPDTRRGSRGGCHRRPSGRRGAWTRAVLVFERRPHSLVPSTEPTTTRRFVARCFARSC